jgi:DNA modification methylase
MVTSFIGIMSSSEETEETDRMYGITRASTRFASLAMRSLRCIPTVKPVAMIADAIRDVTKHGDIILDPFCGSGTTIIAAEKTGRIARCVEIDCHYCDVAVRRWQTFTGKQAILAETGETFEEVTEHRNKPLIPEREETVDDTKSE